MKYLSLDYEYIKATYPLSVELIENWYMGREEIVQGMKNIGSELQGKELVKNLTAMVIQHDPRKLYDTFDDLGIRIYISSVAGRTDEGIFYSYNSEERKSKPFNTRIEAEKDAFMGAFNVLEQRSFAV